MKHDTSDLMVTELQADKYSDEARQAVVDTAVPERYRGTTADQYDMVVLGKKQVLRRNFKFVTMLGFASTVMVAWEYVQAIRPSAMSMLEQTLTMFPLLCAGSYQ